ncbi:MAG: acetyl-CoA carboxylase biotin carboxyl carrier protein subunit [Candidatus Zixiibacteriota bacterium]|nr:MAG: acetyl-CoA carboxylase biotin carboxyl carrier protein subunit [candidate division Zixibacteria bacterium]
MVDGRPMSNSVVTDQEHHRLLMLLDSRSFDAEVYRSNGVTSVLLAGREFPCIVEDERLVSIRKVAGLTTAGHDTVVKAPMPGLIVRLLKNVGDAVIKGERLLIVEAMKMENELKSPIAGKVKEIHVAVGRPVDKGQILITLSGHDEEVL